MTHDAQHSILIDRPAEGPREPLAAGGRSRNPFGVPDVPDPDGVDVAALDARIDLAGAPSDDNATSWHDRDALASIEGNWSSRWNGEGFDWKPGRGRLAVIGDRAFILFDWDDGGAQGLIEARRVGSDRLVGRYLNLAAPEIQRPWVGLIVDAGRIDGAHSGGRIDFRR